MDNNLLGITGMGEKYFFDVPVYRLARDKYYHEFDTFKARLDIALCPEDSPYTEEIRARIKAEAQSNVAMQDHRRQLYGGCWEFNEIIGYIRLHFLGSQVRGEYYGVSKKRIVRTRTKTFDFQTWKLAPEVQISCPPTRALILEAIREYLTDCKKELPMRYVDTSMFEAIADHVDWAALLHSS